MSATRLATRIAVREARRRPFRSLLVVALVAIPVMGMTVATTLIRTDDRTALEQWDDEYGTTDLRASIGADAEPDDAFLDGLPAGTRYTTVIETTLPVRDEANRAFARFVALDWTNPILGGRYTLLDGRPPADGHEVAVNRSTASKFDVGPGDTLDLVRPGVSFDVVGIVSDRECVHCDVFIVQEQVIPVPAFQGFSRLLLIDLPGTPTATELLAFGDTAATGGTATSYIEPRPVPGIPTYDASPDAAIRWSIVVGALALAVVGIVIAAAFTVGARRQLVLLGQLSANGASESILKRTLVLQGTVTGITGAVVGISGGLLGLHQFQGTVERFLDRRLAGYDIALSSLITIAAIGVAGATLAALVPARSAARIPTLHALAGRRPVERVRASFTGSGVVAVIAGLGLLAVATIGARSGQSGDTWAAVAILGGLGVLFGATALTPAMVERLEPFAGRARGTLRLAARSLARNRTRSGAVIAAVAAAGALAVGGTATARAVDTSVDYTSLRPGTAVASFVEYDPETGFETHLPVPTDVDASLRETFPDATFDTPTLLAADVTIDYPPDPTTGDTYAAGGNSVLVVDEGLAERMGLSSRARKALRTDGIVVIDYDDGPEQDVTVRLAGHAPIGAALRFSRYSLDQVAAGVYVTPETAATLDLPTTESPLFISTAGPFTEIQLFDLSELYGYGDGAGGYGISASNGGENRLDLQIGFERNRLDTRLLELLLAAVSVLFALIVVAIGLALAAADEADERETLTVAGAGPGVLARVSGSKAWILATLGFLLAVPVGFLPAATVVSSSGQQSRALYFPTSVVLTLVVIAPLAVGVLAFGVTSVTRRVRPVRISTATFD